MFVTGLWWQQKFSVGKSPEIYTVCHCVTKKLQFFISTLLYMIFLYPFPLSKTICVKLPDIFVSVAPVSKVSTVSAVSKVALVAIVSIVSIVYIVSMCL